jgi:hypothetical protein
MESILKTISHMIGPSEDYDYFNTDLIIHINTAFSRLCQLGVGPSEPFYITDESDHWDDFISEEGHMEDIKTFIYCNVKHDFDPPTNSFLMEALERKIEKLEWLLNSVAEVGY